MALMSERKLYEARSHSAVGSRVDASRGTPACAHPRLTGGTNGSLHGRVGEGIRVLSVVDSSRRAGALRSGEQLPQHVRQNPTVLVVVDFDRRIDAANDRQVLHLSVCTADPKR